MKYLLDTHTLIWFMTESASLSFSVKKILQDPRNKIYVSAISFWEIAIKIVTGKMSPIDFNIKVFIEQCKKSKFTILPVVPSDSISYLSVPLFQNHRDPFDRMIIATAIERGYTLLSRDLKLPQYNDAGLRHLW